jgi:hypothetical protein
VSIALIASIAVVLPSLGFTWSPLSAASGVLVVLTLAAVVAVIARSVRRRQPSPAPEAAPIGSRWVVPAAWAGAGVLIAAQLVFVYGRPDAVSQTFDNGFHLNAVRFILESGNASSFSLTQVIGSGGVYPAAWHDLVSLVAMTSGAEVAVAATATNVLVAAAVWPGAMILLIRVLFPARTAPVVIVAVLAAAVPWFPLLPLTFGVLYPYFLAAALVPIAFALAITFLGRGSPLGASRLARVVALVATLGAIALAQPALVFVVVAFAIPPFCSMIVERVRRSATAGARVAWIVGAILALTGLIAAWLFVGRFGANAPWGASVGPRGGLLETALLFRGSAPASVFFAVATIVGLAYLLWKRERLWLAGVWLIGAVLFFASEVLVSDTVRTLLLGLFYKDPPRFAVVLTLAALPVAVVGVLWVWDAVRRRWSSITATGSEQSGVALGSTPTGVVAIGVAALFILIVVGQGPAMASAISNARATYSFDDPAPILSHDELALIERLPEATDPDGVIAGNPWTGTNLAYAIADRAVLNPHFNLSGDPDHVIINTRLVDAAEDPEVCEAVRRQGVEYALDFGSYFRDAAGLLRFDATASYPGLVGLDDAEGFEEIDREGDSVLYRITAC